MTTENTIEAWLFEHEDGRHAVGVGGGSPDFTRGDPKWHRVGPVDVSRVIQAATQPTASPEQAEAPSAVSIVRLSPLPAPDFSERVYGGHGNEIVNDYFEAHTVREYARQEVYMAEEAWKARATQPTASNAGELPDPQVLHAVADYECPKCRTRIRYTPPIKLGYTEEQMRAALATKPPAGEQKPVGVVESVAPGAGGFHVRLTGAMPRLGDALYLGPQPEQVAQDKIDAERWRVARESPLLLFERWDSVALPADGCDAAVDEAIRAARARGEGGSKG